jgi:hypothetical protein
MVARRNHLPFLVRRLIMLAAAAAAEINLLPHPEGREAQMLEAVDMVSVEMA